MHTLNALCDVEFVAQLRLHAAGHIDDERLKQAILRTRFFAQAPEHPGFVVTATSAGPLIPVFTTQLGLARHAGAVRWFSTTGADMMSLAPVGHRFVIDPGTQHGIVVDPAVFEAADGSPVTSVA